MEAIAGQARLYIAPVGTALPVSDGTTDDIPALLAGTFPSFEYFGDTTEDGVTVADSKEFSELFSGQADRAQDDFVTKLETLVSTTLQRYSAERVADLISGAADVNGTVTPGGVGRIRKFAIALVGPWSEAGEQCLVTAGRCGVTSEFEVKFSTSWANTDVEFKVYEDPDNAQPVFIYTP